MLQVNYLNDTPHTKLIPWLTYTDCLSEKLKSVACNVKMQVLSEMFRKINWWEKYYLSIFDEVFHREIVMYSNYKPCWYARTIIPKNTYKLHLNLFKRLNDEPLGNLLFEINTKIVRTSFIYYPVDKNNFEFYWCRAITKEDIKYFWVRASTFKINTEFFYLTEIFLPEFLSVIKK